MLKTALVTGANQGIGYEIAKGLLKTGKFRVIITSRKEDAGKSAAARLVAETSVPDTNVMLIANFDLLKPETLEAAAKSLAKNPEDPRPLDCAIMNAGFAFNVDAKEDTFQQATITVGTNYFGTKECCKHFLPLVKDGGRVVFVSSRAGLINNFTNQALIDEFQDAPNKMKTLDRLDELMNQYIALTKIGEHTKTGWPNTTYQTSKIAESALSRLLALAPENRARHLKINCYTPGYCQTNMTCFAEDAKRSAAQGAETAIWLAADEGEGAAGSLNGEFLDEEQKVISYFDGKRL